MTPSAEAVPAAGLLSDHPKSLSKPIKKLFNRLAKNLPKNLSKNFQKPIDFLKRE
jgi:hypothetical protein